MEYLTVYKCKECSYESESATCPKCGSTESTVSEHIDNDIDEHLAN